MAELALDVRLPQRDALLDSAVVAERLARLLGPAGPIPVERCERLRVNYEVAKSLRLVYRFELRGTSYTLAARAFPEGWGEKAARVYAEAAATAVSCGPVRPVAHDPELRTVFWTLPNDRRIAHLPALWTDPSPLARQFPRPWVSSRLVAYAPEKAATLQCLDQTGAILGYARVGGKDDGERAYHVHEALWPSLPARDPHLRLPRAIAYSPTYRTLLTEPMPGRRLADLPGAELSAGLRGLGAALARLHSFPLPRAPRFARFDTDQLREAARLLGWVQPGLAGAAEALAERLASRWSPPAEEPVWLHGDVKLANAILDDGHVALVDFEDVASGPAAADVASLLAALRYRRRVGTLSDTDERDAAAAFLEGYAAVRALPESTTLRWYTAAALLVERALRVVRRTSPEGLRHLDELLADAGTLLA